jgi:peptidoglycan/xylan/chitin deacetylase (PgdA/CDA1 family)
MKLRRGRGVVSLTFDDGTSDQLPVAMWLAERGVPATFYVNSGRVGGGPGFLDWDDLATIAAHGHEIGGHTVDHPDLTTLAAEEAAHQIGADRAALLDRGYAAATFAYPYGARSRELEEVVAAASYSAARRAWGLSAETPSETRPPERPFAIRTLPSVERTATAAELVAAVRAGSSGWVPLVFHLVGDGDSTYETRRPVFEHLVAALLDAKVRFVTVAEALAG